MAEKAHALKGAASSVGLTALADVAKRLEMAGQTGTIPDGLGGLVAAHAVALETLNAVWRRYCADDPMSHIELA